MFRSIFFLVVQIVLNLFTSEDIGFSFKDHIIDISFVKLPDQEFYCCIIESINYRDFSILTC